MEGWRQHDPAKCWFPTTQLNDIITQKATTWSLWDDSSGKENYWNCVYFICATLGLVLLQVGVV